MGLCNTDVVTNGCEFGWHSWEFSCYTSIDFLEEFQPIRYWLLVSDYSFYDRIFHSIINLSPHIVSAQSINQSFLRIQFRMKLMMRGLRVHKLRMKGARFLAAFWLLVCLMVVYAYLFWKISNYFINWNL